MDLSFVTDPSLKEAYSLSIMHSLPLWFSPPEDIHNRHTADIYNMGILEEYHHQGLGHRLVEAVLDWCQKEGFTFLTVKTLDASAHYPPYNGTRAFYEREGFLPLEVFPTFWDEENPCLFLARTVK